MIPPGRRKLTSFSFLPILLLLALATSASAASAVLGIDFGTEYFKAAIAKPGSPIEIVLTKDSKRKEAAALAFKPARTQIKDDTAFPERLYGGDALALSARFPTDVFPNLKSILGLPSDATEVKAYLSRFPGLKNIDIPRSDKTASGSTVGFLSQSFSKDGQFMVEELLAMEFQNIKANAQAVAGKNMYVNDAVITYPAYYTAEEKRAIELAADLAGLRVLGLMSDGLAVGLNYATHRTFESVTNGAKPEYHVIYDMGAGSTTATVVRFQGKTVKGPGKKNTTFQEVQVVGYGADSTLGGDALNDLIVADMVNKFIESPRMKPFKLPAINVKKHGKTMARLWKDAEKVRQVLSANSIAYASQEGLFYEDVNFKYSLSRDDFEAMAADFAARISGPLDQALLMADVQLDDVTSVILHGGMIRTPLVQKQLEKAAGGAGKIKTNVNADEAAAMGAAFKAASISPSFRVKDIRAIDISGVPYTLTWTSDGKTREQKIFVPTSQVGIEKQVTIKSQQDVSLEFKQDISGSISSISSITLNNLTKSTLELKDTYGCDSANITTTVSVRLSPFDGIPEVVSASVSCTGHKGKDGGVLGKAKGLFGFGKKGQEPLTAGDESDVESETPLPIDDPTSSGTIVSSATAVAKSAKSGSSASPSGSASTKPKPSLTIIPLSHKYQAEGMNQPALKELPTVKQRLAAFDASDRTAVLRAESLNVLEAFTYRARDYLEDTSFITMSTEILRKELEDQLSTISDWLYGDGIDATLDDFKQRLKGLKSIVDPVLKRKDESSKRQAAIDAVQDSLASSLDMINVVRKQIEKSIADAAEKASSAASSVVDQATSSVAAMVDGEELDEDPYTTDKKSETILEDMESAFPKAYEYNEEDLSTLTNAYETAKTWLQEKLDLQEKLQPFDDPAVLVADLQAQSKKLQNSVTDLIMKQVRMSSPKPKKAKSAKPVKAKTKKTKSVSNGSTATATPTATPTSVAESATDSASTSHVIDEL